MTVLDVHLVRTGGGALVHRSNCRAVQRPVKSIPWLWAEGREVDEVERAMPLVGARACLDCHPFPLQRQASVED